MLKIMNKEIEISKDIEVILNTQNVLSLQTKLGKLERKLSNNLNVTYHIYEGSNKSLLLESNNKTILRTEYKNILNMLEGVFYGYQKVLHLVGVGYKAYIEGSILVLKLGFSHEVKYPIPMDINIICLKPTEILIFGISKEYVNQIAYSIRNFKKPDIYKGKGLRFNNEEIKLKEGKKK